jgi:hypothetical protein
MYIDEKGKYVFINGTHLNRAIVEDCINLVRAKLSSFEFSLEIFEYGIIKQCTITNLELFSLD